ncbi:MAG TPA: arylsulfatase [Acidobacteriaceae bacterium]
MKVTQRTGLLLSATLATSCFSLAQTVDATAPRQDSSPRHTAVARSGNERPFWPESPKAPAGAPNVLLVLVDDVGFGTTTAFGGPITTPSFDKLAASGLRYNSFHVNSLCSPTRAALLTGRNNHEVGFGTIAEGASGYPGYNSLLPKSSATIAEILKENGYSTAAVGKWHNTPAWQVSPAGPFDRWPTGLGFEHFYGFLAAADNQYYPRIYRDNTPVEPQLTPQQGYHFTTDITDDAIRWLHQHDAVAKDKPFFLYYATGAVHTPHQVAQKWIEPYKGKFDKGWDKLREETFARQKALGVIPANAELTPRPDGLPAWDSLTPAQKKLLAHQAEVYAGYTTQTDYEIGRLLDAIHEEGQADNTIVLEIFGDNGASAEGGLDGNDAHDVTGRAKTVEERLDTADLLGSEMYMNHYAAAWAWALSSPFQGTKQDASHLGGTTDPLVVSWPGHIKDAGGVRSQFAHVNDIASTLYDIIGIKPPASVNGVAQTPLEGSSLAYTFDHSSEPSHHHTQYFATSGNIAIYKDGWWAGNRFRSTWEQLPVAGKEPDLNEHPWELYNLNADYSQAHDLSEQNPEKLKELQQLFNEEANRNQAYPLLPRSPGYAVGQAKGQTVFTYREGVGRIVPRIAPSLAGHAYMITADIEVPRSGANGVIFAQGSRYGGFSLFVRDHRVVYEINAFGNRSGQLVASDPLQSGKAHIVLSLTPGAGGYTAQQVTQLTPRKVISGVGQLTINGKAEGQAQFVNVNVHPSETLDIGSDLGSPVSPDYASPNRFTGKIDEVTIELK